MEFIQFIQKFLIFLLPGIIGMFLYKTINIHKEQHYYFEFLKIIVLSFFSFLITDLLFGLIKIIFPCFIGESINIIKNIGSLQSEIPALNVGSSIIFAVILSCILTKAHYKNWIFKIANKLSLTRRVDNETVWEHVFDDKAVIVFRDYITKNTYYGAVQSFSDNSENRELYLKDVYVYNEYAEFLYHAEFLYLSRKHNEFCIELHDDQTKEN